MFVVVELQTNTDGTLGNLVYAYANRDEAEQKYHLILAAAAVSSLPVHAAVMLNNDGHSLMHQCYRHGGPEPTEADEE